MASGLRPISRRSFAHGSVPVAPPSMMWSIRLWPSSPLVLPSPLGNSAVPELSRMRVDSRADALAAELLEQDIPAFRLGRVQLPRRQEFSVRQVRQVFLASLDANELLDVAPPRSQIFIAKGPVDAISLACVRLEVEIAPAIDAAPPHDRAPADVSSADPIERLPVRKGIRIVEIVDEELARVLVAGTGVALDRLKALQ